RSSRAAAAQRAPMVAPVQHEAPRPVPAPSRSRRPQRAAVEESSEDGEDSADAFVESLARPRDVQSEMDDPDAEDDAAAGGSERSGASLASVEDFRKRIAAQRSRSARAGLAI